MATKASSPHCLLIPFPEYGHISPILSLASNLAASGCTVTFLAAQKAPLIPSGHTLDLSDVVQQKHALPSDVDSAAANSMPASLRFRKLPYTGAPSLLTDRSPRFEVLKETLASLEDRHQSIETLVEEARDSDAPISCIICDILLCSWAIPLAKRQHIMSAVLLPCSLTVFFSVYLGTKRKPEQVQRLLSSIGFSFQNPASMVSTEQSRIPEEKKRAFHAAFTSVEQASCVLANSCKGLETEALEMLAESEYNVRIIGPYSPAEKETETPGRAAARNAMAKLAGSPFTEDESCMPWLDKQGKDSVLLVSFGSEGIPDAEQIQELAMGIEGSGCKFLWVVRPETHSPPTDFLERTRDVGMCVSWLPQRKVLRHSAVGGFLTHCGWNSTLEGIRFGVPMLCFPLNADQFLNSHLIHSHWKVGMRLGPDKALVQRSEVERCIRELMGSEKLRQRVGAFQNLFKEATIDCKNSINDLVQDISKCSSQQ